ncbi:MAG: L-rhamnose/proton symporter RhaT [Opitutaceae bacterium]|nr:L-rhamnose/proton symporter RhaT [Opitutaceae bacterium]
MGANPLLGLIYHWLGGFASASFYLPYRGVKRWSWETYWLVGGFFSWIVAPWFFASLLVPDLFAVLRAAPAGSVLWAYVFGALWGLGGLTFGLTMRYLGIGLGMAVALSFCSAFGTLMPPLFAGELGTIAASVSGRYVLLGVAVCLGGIGLCGMAGVRKERELSPEQKKASVREFNFRRGLLVAVFSGVMSSCFAYGLAAGKPIADLARQSLADNGGSDLWQNLPVLIVVLLGGITTNSIWCLILAMRNRSLGEYGALKPAVDAGSGRASLVTNYAFSAMAGVTWYLQFFFYSMGQTKMGQYEFSSWTLHMASIILFSSLWGIVLKEWKGSSHRTHGYIFAGIAVLVLSTLVVGYGNYLGASGTGH